MSSATQNRSTYDPGTPGEILTLGRNHFAVESFREGGVHYSVDLEAGTCSCPDHLYRRRECKHLQAALAASAPAVPATRKAPVTVVYAKPTATPEVRLSRAELLLLASQQWNQAIFA